MDPMRFLESNDDVDVAIMQAIAGEYMRIRQELDENTAKLIANAVWSAVK